MAATKWYVKNIDWDTDGEEIDNLPTETEIFTCEDDVNEIADALSDEYEFCVNSFEIIQRNDEDYIEEEYEEHYSPSATNRDYSPSNPWDAPGMSIRDFI